MKKERKQLPLDRIELNTGQLPWLPKNPRTWTQSDIDRTATSIREDTDFLEDRPLLVTPCGEKFVAFAGNLRREGAAAAKLASVPAVVYHPENDTDFATIKRRAMKDNGSFGSWDWDELANSWDDLPLADWGVPAWPEDEQQAGEDGYIDADEDTNNYSRKIEVPSYEPSGDNPMLSEIYDTTKRDGLIEQIEAANIPDDVKRFLITAAGRHTVFHYDKIADYYANASKEVQGLMEQSALVIIDMGGAIDNGFVKLANKIAAQYKEDYGE